MFVTKYVPKEDNWTLMRIMKKREKDPKEIYNLPEVGFLAFEEDYFIGAGFLRKCEGNYGMFDSYVTDPEMPAILRNQALDIITKRLISIARDMGIKHLIAISVDTNTIMRSQRHGFVLLPEHKLLTQVL